MMARDDIDGRPAEVSGAIIAAGQKQWEDLVILAGQWDTSLISASLQLSIWLPYWMVARWYMHPESGTTDLVKRLRDPHSLSLFCIHANTHWHPTAAGTATAAWPALRSSAWVYHISYVWQAFILARWTLAGYDCLKFPYNLLAYGRTSWNWGCLTSNCCTTRCRTSARQSTCLTFAF